MGELISLEGQKLDPASFLDPYYPRIHGSLPARCGEDRPEDTPYMVHGLQIFSGAAGESGALALGIESKQPGAFVEADVKLDDWSTLIAKIMRSRFHEQCAGLELREPILGFMVRNPDLVFATARELHSGISPEAFERNLSAVERLLNNRLAVVGDIPERQFKPLQKASDGGTLVHAGRQVVAIHAAEGEQVLWNTRRAWEAAAPAYGLNVGMYDQRAADLNAKVGPIIGHVVEDESFVTAAVSFAASTIHNLPKTNGQPPSILNVAA